MASPTRPHGREEVRSALIDAAVQIFAHRVPNQVTVRELAERANVNQGLVHEYFDSKEGLIKATIAQLAQQRAELSRGNSELEATFPLLLDFHLDHPAFARLLAWWMLEGHDLAELDLEFESIEEIAERAATATDLGRVDHRVLGTAIGSMIMGAVVFQDYARSRGLDAVDDEQVRRELGVVASAMYRWNRGTN